LQTTILNDCFGFSKEVTGLHALTLLACSIC
jgi:hypothetical protein